MEAEAVPEMSQKFGVNVVLTRVFLLEEENGPYLVMVVREVGGEFRWWCLPELSCAQIQMGRVWDLSDLTCVRDEGIDGPRDAVSDRLFQVNVDRGGGNNGSAGSLHGTRPNRC